MSSRNDCPQATRPALIEALVQAIYQNSTATVFFHTVMAEQIGLGATEEKTLFLLNGAGPLTAGEIAQHTGLATASVTSLLDRLERKGFVRRVRDRGDRRRVMVELDETRFAELVRLFDALGDTFSPLLDGFSDEHLIIIMEFLTRATQYTQQAMAQLRAATADREGA